MSAVKLAKLVRQGLREAELLANVAVTGEDARGASGLADGGCRRVADGRSRSRRCRQVDVETPADGYLIKPFDSGKLLSRLRVLGRRRPCEREALLEAWRPNLDPASREAHRRDTRIRLSVYYPREGRPAPRHRRPRDGPRAGYRPHQPD